MESNPVVTPTGHRTQINGWLHFHDCFLALVAHSAVFALHVAMTKSYRANRSGPRHSSEDAVEF